MQLSIINIIESEQFHGSAVQVLYLNCFGLPDSPRSYDPRARGGSLMSDESDSTDSSEPDYTKLDQFQDYVLNEMGELEARICGLEAQARQSSDRQRFLAATASTTAYEGHRYFSGAARVVEDRRRFGTFGLGLAVGILVAAVAAAVLVWRQ